VTERLSTVTTAYALHLVLKSHKQKPGTWNYADILPKVL